MCVVFCERLEITFLQHHFIQRLQQLQQDLQHVHVRLHMHSAHNPEDEVQSARVQELLQQEHGAYRANCAALREGKRQVKMLQAVLERNRAELQQRFQAWRGELQAVAPRNVTSHQLHRVSSETSHRPHSVSSETSKPRCVFVFPRGCRYP